MLRMYTLSIVLFLLMAIVGNLINASAENLSETLTREGYSKVIQKGENPFYEDPQAKGIQVFRVNDFSVFMNEAARAHVRLSSDYGEEIRAKSYRYLIPFYKTMIRDDFRESCQKTFPRVGVIPRNEGLQTAVDLGKEAFQTIQSTEYRIQIMLDWYEALGQIRAEALLRRGFMDRVDSERNIFLGSLESLINELIVSAKPGKTAFYAEYLRVMGSRYALWPVVKNEEGSKLTEFDIFVNEGLLRYAMGIAQREDIPFQEKMQTLAEGSFGLKKLRELRGLERNQSAEAEFTNLVDSLCQTEEARGLSPVSSLQLKVARAMIRWKLVPEFWGRIEIRDIDSQPEPKPYKAAINIYRNLALEAETLLSGSLSEEERRRAELAALEAQTWVCQLLQDNGIVMSSDFTLDEAKAENLKLQQALARIEENRTGVDQNTVHAIYRARVIWLDYLKYHEDKQTFQTVVDLTETYLPEIFPNLDKEDAPFPEPEGRPDVRYGAGMLLWRGIALKELGRFEEAIAVLTQIKVGMNDRFDDPYISARPVIRGVALSNLHDMDQMMKKLKQN